MVRPTRPGSPADRPPARPLPPSDCPDPLRRGLGAVEVIIIIAIVGFFLLWFLTALPRWRETARMAGCQKNMMQIGVALQLYHQASRHFPSVPPPGGATGDSPVAALLRSLSLPDFLDLRDPGQPARPGRPAQAGLRVPGLACPSDPPAMAGPFRSSISYRADAGTTVDGRFGPFSPGRTFTNAQIEAGHGLGYTSAFAERLVGTGDRGRPSVANYAVGPGPVAASGCPDAAPDRWRGDAGSDWGDPGWRSALFNHVLRPGAAGSCLADDGRTASMGVSSAHPGRINVLLMDGSLRGVTPTMDPKVWDALGTVDPPVKAP